MPIESVSVVVLAIVFLAALARSTFGFGDALIAMPLLSLLSDANTVHFSKPLVAMVTATTAGLMLVKDWRSVHFKSAAWLVLSAAFGIPLGLLFLTNTDERVVKAVLAVVVIAFSVYALWRPNLMVLHSDKPALLFGFMAGVLGGAYNTHGPPLVIYGAMRRWPAERFRATLQGYFVPAALLIVGSDGLNGRWTRNMLLHFVYSLPLMIAAVILGQRLSSRFNPQQFIRYIYILLIGVGIILLLSSLSGR